MAPAESEDERLPAGLEGLAWLFGVAALLAPPPPARREDDQAEAPPRAA